MKSAQISLLCLSFALLAFFQITLSIAHGEEESFIQGDIRIALPVKILLNKEGLITEKSFNDGGTFMVTIIDSNGHKFDVYIDHRIGNEKNWGVVYLNGYPEEQNSVRILNQAKFRQKILQPLNLN